MQPSKYDDILTSIAGRFYCDLPHNQMPTREKRLETFKHDLLSFTSDCDTNAPWALWLHVQKQCRSLADRQFDRHQAYRMQNEEILFLSESALHLRNGGHSLFLCTETIERVSAWSIDRNIVTKDVQALHLPDYIWIEWKPFSKLTHPPWISRTVGMLISRFAAFDAPRHRLVSLLERADESKDYTCEMIRAVARNVVNGIPCFGYEVIIVQQDEHGYRFISCVFGHELTEPLVDMLTLHKEMSDRDNRKFRQAEQVWTNVAMRLLLASACSEWCTNAEHPIFIEDPGSCTTPDTMQKLYARDCGQRREIAVRPDYRTSFKPFAITNE